MDPIAQPLARAQVALLSLKQSRHRQWRKSNLRDLIAHAQEALEVMEREEEREREQARLQEKLVTARWLDSIGLDLSELALDLDDAIRRGDAEAQRRLAGEALEKLSRTTLRGLLKQLAD